ncbi:MAG TPA: hypothetical protein VF219_19145, partial [Vicinamibacterales bacterium]
PNAIAADWPLIAGKYELKRLIQFDVEGQLSGAKWELPLFAQCGNDVPDGFFNEHKPLQTHAIIEFQAGDLCTWRFVDKDGKPGAAGTRLTFVNPASFTIRRNDGKYISLDVTRDCEIMLENSEEAVDPGNDDDWLWYYVATGSSCTNTPASFDFEATCDAPPGIRPLSLGCSNSQWP